MSYKKSKYGSFDHNTFRGEKVESLVPKNPGIYYIWYWDAEKGMYVSPPSPIKPYRAIRRRLVGSRTKKEHKCFPRLEEARDWRFFKGSDDVALKPNEASEKTSGGPKFEEVVQMRKQLKWRSYAESTKVAYEKLLKYLEFFNGMEIRSIAPSVIDEWLMEMTSEKVTKEQHSTRENYDHELATLSGILRYYADYHDDPHFVFPVKKRHWEAAVVKRVRNKKRDPMTPKQFDEWIAQLKKQKNGLMKETLARTQRSGALRISEAAAIHWDDIDWKKRFITIQRAIIWPRRKGWPTFIQDGFKNGDTKEVPITPDAYRLLLELKLQQRGPLVFHSDGKPLDYRYIQFTYDKAFKQAGLPFSATHVPNRWI